MLFYEPRSGEPIFFGLFYEPRSGEPIFLAITSREAASRFSFAILNPVSDVFLASTNAMEDHDNVFSSPRGGGGVKPYCLRLSLRQSAIGTYCVGLDIL